VENNKVTISVRDLKLSYNKKEVIHGISFDIYRNEIFSIIGPAQSGKSSLLKCLNRTIEFTSGTSISGTVEVDGQNVRTMKNVFDLRRRIGMVAPLPVGLPISIYDNVAFAPRCSGLTSKGSLDPLVEKCLRQAALWDEVKDRLHSLGTALSGGQQQRLTIARAMRIEDVLIELKNEMTIILVTNLTHQAKRLGTRTMFLYNGNLIEVDTNEVIFSQNPGKRETYEYINGLFG
jgi:phosphate transport system ATP-binding protein